MNGDAADRIGNVMKKSLEVKINRLIDQRNAIQKLINVLDEQRTRLEKPHYKGDVENE